MMESQVSRKTGIRFLEYALIAFAGLGIEVLLWFVLEPVIYGCQPGEWSTLQNICHWILTCICWGAVFFFLSKNAKKECGYDLFAQQEKVKSWQWAVVAVLFALKLAYSWYDWNGSKVVREFCANGWLKFIFQYIYYVFEIGLVYLIIAFGQKAFEAWFHQGARTMIPYGGLLAGLTWGLAHILTKGSLTGGLALLLISVVYGLTWLLLSRDIRKAFPVLYLMFVL
jgi:hypothetical protein